jgi:hypothetical protein
MAMLPIPNTGVRCSWEIRIRNEYFLDYWEDSILDVNFYSVVETVRMFVFSNIDPRAAIFDSSHKIILSTNICSGILPSINAPHIMFFMSIFCCWIFRELFSIQPN